MLRLFAISIVIAFFAVGSAIAQPPHGTQQRAARPLNAPHTPKTPPNTSSSGGTVGVIGGDIDSTGLRIASDLSRALDNDGTLRIVPMAGKGPLQNLTDLLTLKEADIAIVQSDVLNRFAKSNNKAGAASPIQYVAKLYSEEFHVLSRMQFLCLQDLTGRKVSFGPKASGMAITAEAVFEANGIAVNPLYLDHDEAIERLKRGEIDALVYVGGKPSRAFEKITHKDKVHFLDVEYRPELQANYLPAVISAEDYPGLVAPNESVGTIAISTVMAVQNIPPQSERFRVLSQFTDAFFSNIDRLKAAGFASKWREVDIRAPLKGWQRFQPAERWLAENAMPNVKPTIAPAAPPVKAAPRKFVKTPHDTAPAQDDLFNKFFRWYQNQNAPQH